MPKPIPNRRGRLVERGWTCERFMPGRLFSASELPSIKPGLSKFHNDTAGIVQRPGFASSTDLLRKAQGGNVDFSRMPNAVVEAWRAAWAGQSTGVQAAIHGDLS